MVFKAGPRGVGYYREGHPANGEVKSLDELSARELKSRLDALDVDYSTALDKQELRRLISQVRARARSHCRFVLPFIRFIPDSLTYSVPLFLKRQCDRTLVGQP